MRRFTALLLICMLMTGVIMAGISLPAFAEPASAAGVDCMVSTGQFSTAFVDENNVLYMTGSAKNIPWHHEGNAVSAAGSAIWSTPVRVMDNVRSVSCGYETFGVIRTDGSLWMWGDNTGGLVGNKGAYDEKIDVPSASGSTVSYYYQNTPVKVMENVTAFAITDNCCAAVKTDGSLWMWGTASRMPVRPNKDLWKIEGKQDVPLKIMDNVRCVSCTMSGIAVVKTDGTLWTWGSTGYPSNGFGYDVYWTQHMDHVKAVSCGSLDYLAILKDDGSLWMAGRNDYGQLGNGKMDENGRYVYTEPFKILDHVVQFTTGYRTTAAVTESGELYVWGDRSMCGLGDGSMVAGKMSPTPEACITTPKKILDGAAAVDLPRNQHRGFAVKKDGTLWAWGVNRNGELGNGYEGDGSGSVSGSDGTSRSFPIQSSPVRIMSGIRAAGFPGQPSAPAAPAMNPEPSAWAKSIVERAIEMKLVPEMLQGNYTMPITRAEFCTLAAMLYESRMGEVTGRSAFEDTKDVSVEKMASLGVVAGVGNKKFAPDQNITREQAATMLAALAGVLGKPIEETEPAFADNGDISGWAVPYVGKMQSSGIMNGTGNDRFSPKGSYTREQSIATMLSVLAYVEE